MGPHQQGEEQTLFSHRKLLTLATRATMKGTPQSRSSFESKCQETGVYTSVPPVLPVDCGVLPRKNHSTVDPTAKVYNEREGQTICAISVRCRVPRGSTVAVQDQVQHGSRCGR